MFRFLQQRSLAGELRDTGEGAGRFSGEAGGGGGGVVGQGYENERGEKEKIGDIVEVSFVDRAATLHGTGLKCGLTSPKPACSESQIMILCENTLIFCDTVTFSCRILSVSDFEKSLPTAAVIIASHHCAVGCSDGHVRIFDVRNLKQLSDLTAHSRTEICMLQNIPGNTRSLFLKRLYPSPHDQRPCA